MAQKRIAESNFKRTFRVSACLTVLLAANIAQAAACDNQINCDSPVNITLSGSTCYYSWPTQIYEVPKLAKRKLYWRLVTANAKWDQGNGVRLYGEINDEDQDLKNGHGESDAVFVWESVQSPSDPSAGDKTFLIRMNISYNGSACGKANGEPDYKIVLKR